MWNVFPHFALKDDFLHSHLSSASALARFPTALPSLPQGGSGSFFTNSGDKDEPCREPSTGKLSDSPCSVSYERKPRCVKSFPTHCMRMRLSLYFWPLSAFDLAPSQQSLTRFGSDISPCNLHSKFLTLEHTSLPVLSHVYRASHCAGCANAACSPPHGGRDVRSLCLPCDLLPARPPGLCKACSAG